MKLTTGAAAAREAASFVRAHWSVSPRLGIILGTGLGGLADDISVEASLDYQQIPHFARTTVVGHAGRVVCGHLRQLPVIALAGRSHGYEGHDAAQLQLPVRMMRSLGAAFLIVGSASGGLNPHFEVGQLMAIADHVNLMGLREGRIRERWPPFLPGRCGVYDPQLIDDASRVARRLDVTLHRGVYVAVRGPNYETRAEYRAFRRLGGDAVGMSTVPETMAASQLGMRVLAISTITNVARPDAATKTEAEDVVHAAALATPRLRALVGGLIGEGLF